MNVTLEISAPADFNFWRTVYSHGWCALLPFKVEKDKFQLARVIEISSGKVASLKIMQSYGCMLVVDITSPKPITSKEQSEIISSVRTCLRLDEDFSEFYSEAKKHKDFRWISRLRAGRLLRAPTVFEDVVKMICTTNCSWELTEIMVKNLCTKLGCMALNTGYSFPKPEAIANCTEKFLRKEIRAGYRSPYLLNLAKRVVNKEIELELWRNNNISTTELYKQVCSVKGIGPYAAGNLLKLLGRYDYLGLDSWSRRKFFELHKNGKKTSDKVIEKFYEPFGKWKGLFFWMDVTRDWYKREFPF